MATDIRRVQEILEEALKLPEVARPAYLDRECAGDADLRNEIESLLRHADIPENDFLRPPSRQEGTIQEAGQELVGSQIGGYRIRSVIASGGMGTVYEAEQVRPRRVVALKVMKSGFPSPSQMRRFEYESEVLAQLQHPNIAQVYEAGTHTDSMGHSLPYFVLEYVAKARPINTYCEQENLVALARLELFAQVCEAVHHGHQRGVIHRDLKPGNILVDSAGQVKIIDFGVARMTDSDLAVTTLRTDIGELIGTLPYMSPEQCEADPRGLDIRSDVYSLGVVLYELLIGRLPYEVTGRPIPSATRIICEDDPMRPSSLNRKVRGDLELIVLTALKKKKEQRYDSAGAMAADIRRNLRREPIAAKPPSRWTKAVNWIVRHPRLVTAGSCLAIASLIFAGTVTATFFWNLEPWQLVLSDDESELRLFSRAGRELCSWSSVPHGISTARLLRRPPALGGGQLALVGYKWGDDGPFRGELCAYDVTVDCEQPTWTAVVETHDLPPILVEKREMDGSEFYIDLLATLDVFEARPGPEIVAIHKHGAVTSTALRVYGLDGTLLYQIWLDVDVKALYWMSDAKQLVIAGINGTAFWWQRVHPEEVENPEGLEDHPRVVFAVHPRPTVILKEYLSEQPGDRVHDPIWYRSIGSPAVAGSIRGILLVRPIRRQESGRLVCLWLVVDPTVNASCGVVVDEWGQESTESWEGADEYIRYKDRLPSLELYKLRDLPPPIEPILPGSAFTP